MLIRKREIQRPAVLALLAVAVLAAFGWAGASLVRLHTDLATGPSVLVRDRDELVLALAQAPFTAPEQGRWLTGGGAQKSLSGPTGEPVYLVAMVGCTGCDRTALEVVDALSGQGRQVQVMLVPTSEADDIAAAAPAILARTGDLALALAGGDRADISGLIDPDGEREGHSEWARQSHQRIARVLEKNRLPADSPIVIWRDGPDLLAMPGFNASAHRAVQPAPAH